MTNGTDPALGLVTTATIDAIGAGRAVFTDLTLLELGRLTADAARVEAATAKLLADVIALAGVRSHDEFCDLLRTWGDDLIELAEAVLTPLAPLGVVGKPLAEALVIFAIQKAYPRLASLLSAAGVFVNSPSIGSRFDWERLRDLLLNGPGVVTEDFWDDFLDAANPQESGAVPALLAALLVIAPEAVALRSEGLRVEGLLPPPVSPDASPSWAQLRQRSAGWIPITVPLATSNGDFAIPDSPDVIGGMTPELAMTLLFRSQRRQSGGRTVTDFEMWLQPSVDAASFVLPLSETAAVTVTPSVPIGLGYDGSAGTWNAVVAPRAGAPVSPDTNEALISIGKDDPGKPDLLFGPPDDSRIFVRDLGLDIRLREVGEPSVELVGRARGFGVVLTNRWFRSAGGSISSLRDGVRLDLDVDARYAEGTGFSLAAEGALETRKQLAKSLNLKALTARLHSLLVRVPIRADEDHFDIRAEARLHWSATLGPVTLVMDGAGGWVGWWADTPGDEKHCVGLLPPTGVGLQLDFPGVIAGGFLDFTGGPSDRYGGVVTLTIAPPGGLKGVTVTAFGLHELGGSETDAERPVTFIIVLGTKFRPGVAFGPGIVWNGIGGLYGHNRRADTDALRERLTSGAVGNVLFADDPIRNAPILLGDLAALFPPAAGVQVFGLTAQFGWVPLFGDYLIKAAVGVILEYADRLTRIVILGSLVLHLPPDPDMSQKQREELEKLLIIQVDVIGDIDPVRRTVAIDATIRRGQFLKVFTITGDGGLRASFGDQRYLMATLGGFHPDFHPDPAVFPDLKRILLSIKDTDLPGPIDKLSVAAYMAVTTSTLQFGAELTATISSGHWSIEGKIGGDALITLPFSFDVSIHGGVHVKYRGHNLIGIDFKGGLSGPSPIVLRGEVCVSLLLFDACWSDSIEIGGGEALPGPLIASLVPIIGEELANAANLEAAAEDPLVLLALPEAPARPVLSPLVAPTWSQSRVPLGLPIETFEEGHLDPPRRLNVSASRATSPQLDWFSPGAFVALSEAEEMALPSFEQHQAGVSVTADFTRSASVVRPSEVEEIRLPESRRVVPGFTFPRHVIDRLDAVEGEMSIRPRPGRFELRGTGFSVDAAGVVVATGTTAVQARLVARGSNGAVQHPTDRLVEV
jgi:hypothetical protein